MKKFIKFAFVAAIAAVAGYNVYQSQSVMNGMSDFALANVEALAQGEIIVDFPCTINENETCKFTGRLADGTTGLVEVVGAENVKQ